MLPNLANLPPYSVLSFVGVMVTLAFMWRRLSRFSITRDQFLNLFALCILTGFLGSKLLYFLVLWFMEDASWGELPSLFMASGYVFYGGLFGVLFGVWLFARQVKGPPLQELLQMVAPALPLFHGFGRIGCALAGCCYGVTLSAGIMLPGGYELYRFPTQITEAVFEFALFVVLCFWEKRQGQVDLLRAYLLSYAVFRFFLEHYRADIYRGEWWGLSTSQWISLLIIGYYVVKHIRSRRNKAGK